MNFRVSLGVDGMFDVTEESKVRFGSKLLTGGELPILCFSIRDLIAFSPGLTNVSNLAGGMID